MQPEAFLEQFSKEGEGMLRWIRELQIEGKVLDDCQIIVAGREIGLGEMEITLSHMVWEFESILPKADRETIAAVLENLADRGILRRREGIEPTYALAWSNAEWAKKWVTGSVEVDKKWQMLCWVRHLSSLETFRRLREQVHAALEKRFSREQRD